MSIVIISVRTITKLPRIGLDREKFKWNKMCWIFYNSKFSFLYKCHHIFSQCIIYMKYTYFTETYVILISFMLVDFDQRKDVHNPLYYKDFDSKEGLMRVGGWGAYGSGLE